MNQTERTPSRSPLEEYSDFLARAYLFRMERLGFLPRIGLGYYVPYFQKKDFDTFCRVNILVDISFGDVAKKIFTYDEIEEITTSVFAYAFGNKTSRLSEKNSYVYLREKALENVRILKIHPGRKKVAEDFSNAYDTIRNKNNE